jgi:hypothetical protein
MKYNGYNIPDDVIDSYVDKLGCSIAEACDAWLCDNGKADSAEADAMTKKAQFAGVGKIVDAEYKKGERKPKERKIDKEKQFIITELIEAVLPFADFAEVRNAEKYIDFIYHGNHYTVNLVKHRKKGD